MLRRHEWTCDPGPCPVDDTPHTACTPDSVASSLRQPLQPSQTVEVPVTPPFATHEYRRAVHGPLAARRGAGVPARVDPPSTTPIRSRRR